MAYNTKKIKRDVDGNPVPQVYSPAADEYEALKGDSGAARHVLYGPDGSPVDTTGNKLGVRDDEVAQTLAALLTQLDTALPAGNNKIGKVDVEASALPAGAATEAKQDALAALIGEVEANPTANTILGRMKSLESKIDTLDVVIDSILAKIIAAPSTEAKQDTIIGYVDGVEAGLANILAKIIASPATEAKQNALNALIGEVQANPTANTLLARIKALETKLDGIISGATPAIAELSGSNVTIGTTTYAVSGGDTIRGKSADKPAATDAHALIPYCFYFAVDTGVVEVADGTNWVVV